MDELGDRPNDVERPLRRASGKAYETVLRRIEDEILAGALGVGSVLPAERDLATQMGVSRGAVREAIRALEAQGVLVSGVGVGPAGGTRVTDQRSRALTRLLRLQLALAHFPFREVVELRVALERVAIGLAAQHADDSDLRRMRRALDAMAHPSVSVEVFNELDTEFHLLLARAGQMTLISDLTVAVRESVRPIILNNSREMTDWRAFADDLVRQHEAIYRAVVEGDPERAADLVESHIRLAYAALLA